MRRTLWIAVISGAFVFAGAPPSACVNLTDGPAEVVFEACAQGSEQTNDYIPDCSYLRLAPMTSSAYPFPAYTYLTSVGPMTWEGGTLTGSTLSFPQGGQIPLWSPYGGFTDVTGTIDANGKVDLTLSYHLNFWHDPTSLITNNGCLLTGTAYLSSQGVEALGGQARGKNYDPVTGRFAVVSTSYTAPTQSGLDCPSFGDAYDLTKGMGWYLTGTLSLPSTPVAQTAKVKVAKKIAAKGRTVLMKKAVTTNAGRTARAKLTWSTKKIAKGHRAKYASAKISKSGRLSITTTGKAKKLYVRLSLKAPAVEGYTAYSYTKKWKVK